MNSHLRSALSILGAFVVLAGADVHAADSAQTPATPPPLRVQVDPRVELLSLLFRLAGNPEYSQGKIPSYNAAVEKKFNPFRDQEAVKLAAQLRRSRGVSFDACMSLAVHLNNARDLTLLVPLEPWPEALDKRWTTQDTEKFLAAARRFVQAAGFTAFLDEQRDLFSATTTRLETLMKEAGHLEWFQEFFGERAQASFTLVPGMLNGGSCYGVRCQETATRESLYCILGVWSTDGQGQPRFTRDMVSTVVHEFGHSYANPVIHRHAAELRAAGEALYKPVASQMRAQAYGNGETLLCESLVRACEVRYAFRYEGEAGGRRAIDHQKKRGFLWMQELSDLLADYETQRDRYPTLEAFAPRLVAFFKDQASQRSGSAH